MWCRFKVIGAFLNWPCCRQIQFRARSPRGLESFPRAKRLGGRSKLFFFLIVSKRHTFFLETYIFPRDIHFSWRYTFFLEIYIFLIRDIHFSNQRHTVFLLGTYIFLGDVHFSSRHTFFLDTYIFLGDIHFSWRHTFFLET